MSAVSQADDYKIHEWDKLLRKFEALNSAGKTKTSNSESQFIPQLNQLFDEFDKHQDGWKKEQELRADDFNVLRIMGVIRDELCHSDILAWLLDHQATHAQGNLGFRLLLKDLNLPEGFANNNYRVIRELAGRESRIDIVIEAEGEFIIAIENKVDSEEGEDQTKREWNDLVSRKKALKVKSEIAAFFLTPDETPCSSGNFKPISWQVIAEIFETFAEEAKPELVKMFAKHYAEILRRDIVTEHAIDEEENE
jgi:hypothetical protein